MSHEPFSVREGVRGDQSVIFDDTPEGVRYGLREVLHRLGRETPTQQRSILCKAMLVQPDSYNFSDYPNVDLEVADLLVGQPWYEFLDAVERIPIYLDSITGTQFFELMNQLFADEALGYRFDAGKIMRLGSEEFHTAIREARRALDGDRFEDARNQFEKGLAFRDARPPDWANAIKEAVNSVEAVLQIVCERPGVSMTTILGENIPEDVPSGVKKLFRALYGHGSGTTGSRHAAVGGAAPTAARAELALHVAAALHAYSAAELDSTH